MSNYVKATNFSIKDTLNTGDPNKRIKGTEINDEFVAIATAISSKADSASPSFTGTPTAPTASPGNNTNQIATTAFVFQNGVPLGAIFLWGGLIVDIPAGYALCDGTGGTPNLKDRFVIGSGGTYTTGATGGSKDAVVVSHTHAVIDPGHTHTFPNGQVDIPVTADTSSAYGAVERTKSTSSAKTGITINTAGESGADKNMPPYYALAYIQRVS
jgi:hypothetical protein